jgi:hypothetical protein
METGVCLGPRRINACFHEEYETRRAIGFRPPHFFAEPYRSAPNAPSKRLNRHSHGAL